MIRLDPDQRRTSHFQGIPIKVNQIQNQTFKDGEKKINLVKIPTNHTHFPNKI